MLLAYDLNRANVSLAERRWEFAICYKKNLGLAQHHLEASTALAWYAEFEIKRSTYSAIPIGC